MWGQGPYLFDLTAFSVNIHNYRTGQSAPIHYINYNIYIPINTSDYCSFLLGPHAQSKYNIPICVLLFNSSICVCMCNTFVCTDNG